VKDSSQKCLATSVIEEKLIIETNHPVGENSYNLITLVVIMVTSISLFSWFPTYLHFWFIILSLIVL
jgi:hypothetical protein